MTIRVGINGMGRIGREYLRYTFASNDIEIVAVNDIADLARLVPLLRRDSTFGRFNKDVEAQGNMLIVDGRKIAVTTFREPRQIPWAEHGAEIVIESTGKFRTRDQAGAHLAAGAQRVLISAPGKGVDATIVMGVNDEIYDPSAHDVISNASCTTNCVAPMVKVLHESFGIVQGFMTTVHAITNDQNVLDAPHKDPRRASYRGNQHHSHQHWRCPGGRPSTARTRRSARRRRVASACRRRIPCRPRRARRDGCDGRRRERRIRVECRFGSAGRQAAIHDRTAGFDRCHRRRGVVHLRRRIDAGVRAVREGVRVVRQRVGLHVSARRPHSSRRRVVTS